VQSEHLFVVYNISSEQMFVNDYFQKKKRFVFYITNRFGLYNISIYSSASSSSASILMAPEDNSSIAMESAFGQSLWSVKGSEPAIICLARFAVANTME